ncbi:MAG: ergothioneine biosynthesis protein EgtB [Thiotrichales bacterium]|nr:MAG: ergothioneine biosynthesis protein EgtB [Thiotrichales bacterium]
MSSNLQLDEQTASTQRESLRLDYQRIRKDSADICAPLQTEDYCIQTMPDVSPAKWHLAHTSWFFETFLLVPLAKDYRCFDPAYDHLFNSYYLTHGTPFARPARGLLSRPTVAEVYQYRAAIDEAMQALFANLSEQGWEKAAPLITLGLNHEQQHQELMLTDLKHVFAHNPLRPRYRDLPVANNNDVEPLSWLPVAEGIHEIGHTGSGFGYDNEFPRHRVLLRPFALASRPVTNAEYLEFINDRGYSNPALWLSDGWATVQANNWRAPLYWEERDGEWWHMTLAGMRPVDMHAPVCHVSQYEAVAYANWTGDRLATEFEWETSVAGMAIEGNFRDTDYLQPVAASNRSTLQQCYGDVWEWTASAYAPYPGYRIPEGTVGEYNGKFMSSQAVLRGGSCVTSADHIRSSYRNFFYPKDRWQFSGIRLARDL